MTEEFPAPPEGVEEFDDVDSFVSPSLRADVMFQRLREGKPLGSTPAVDPDQIYGWGGTEGGGGDIGVSYDGPEVDQGSPEDRWEGQNISPSSGEGGSFVLSPSDITVATGDFPGEVVLMIGSLARVILTTEDVQRLIDSLTGSLEVTPQDESFPDNPGEGEMEVMVMGQKERWVRERALRAVAKVYDLNNPKNFPAAKALFEKLVGEYAGWDGVSRKGVEQRSSRKASFRSGEKVPSSVSMTKGKYLTARQRRSALAAAVAKRSHRFTGG